MKNFILPLMASVTFLISNNFAEAQLNKWINVASNGDLYTVDFSTPVPVATMVAAGTGSGMDEDINCITDSSNNILFCLLANSFSNIKVLNKNFVTIPNGDGLKGCNSSMQSNIIPMPCNPNQYYIVHLDAGTHKLYYSIVDMSLDGGLGDVLTKNILINSNQCEAISTSHQLTTGCRWLFTTKVSGNKYDVIRYLVSSGSIGSPVTIATISISSPVYYNDLQLSADNKKLAISTVKNISNVADVYVWDLDLNAGTISNQQLFYLNNLQPVFTIEFSPDAQKLYYRTNSANSDEELGRLNLNTGLDTIIASALAPYQSHIETAGNGKIYNSNSYSPYLAEIDFPNAANISNIGYSHDGAFVSAANIQHGLPHAIQGEKPGTVFTPDYIAFSATATALCNQIQFMDTTCLATDWWWNFGDNTTSEIENPIHQFPTGDTFNVTLKLLECADTVSLSQAVITSGSATVTISQSNDTLFSTFGTTYQWFIDGNIIYGATNSYYVTDSAGNYSVLITDSVGCTATDDISFSLFPSAGFSTPDNIICQKFCNDYFDESTNNPTSWQWTFEGGSPSTSALQNPTQICYNVPGSYDVTLIASNAFGSDTLTFPGYITVYATPPFPTITQNGNVLTSSFATLYQWQFNSNDIPGATSQSYTATETGFYTVEVWDEFGCSSSTTIFIEITGITEISWDGISISPNPSNGKFIIEWENAITSGEISITIINELSQKIISFKENPSASFFKKEIDLSNFSDGIYFIEMKIKDQFLRKKIVIQKL